MKTEKRKVGDLGEKIAAMFLEKNGFSVIDRNYSRPWGEIDLVAKKGEVVHFIEVKTLRGRVSNVIHETEDYRPEDNVHRAKLKRIAKTMQTYIQERNLQEEWCFGVVVISLDLEARKARVKFLENIVL